MVWDMQWSFRGWRCAGTCRTGCAVPAGCPRAVPAVHSLVAAGAAGCQLATAGGVGRRRQWRPIAALCAAALLNAASTKLCLRLAPPHAEAMHERVNGLHAADGVPGRPGATGGWAMPGPMCWTACWPRWTGVAPCRPLNRRCAGPTWPERLRVFRSCPLITPKGARSSLQMLAIARAMAVLCA